MTQEPSHSIDDAMETLKIVHRNEDETCMTFLLENEDHTLGNALRFGCAILNSFTSKYGFRCMIMKNPAVQFCGYAIPHPSERMIHLRIQMHHGLAIDALEKGLQDLRDMMEHIHSTFEETISTYKAVL